MKQVGFRADDGWEHLVWTKDLELVVKGKVHSGLFKRNYLIHRVTGAIITSNPTAWMDTVTMIMWVELQLGPWRAARGRRTLLVMDNCGPHGICAVKDAFAAKDILVEHLPPNMTGELQVMDLVVNGPLKAAIRRERCLALHANFLAWKAEWKAESSKPATERLMKSFEPPAVSLSDGLRTLFATCAKDFRTDGFAEGVRKAFVNVGLAQDTSLKEPFFRKYKGGGRKGTIPRALVSADDTEDAVIFGQLAVQLNMEARPGNADDEESDSNDNEDAEDAGAAARAAAGSAGVAGTAAGAAARAAAGAAAGTTPLPTRTSTRPLAPSKKYAKN